MVEPLTNLLFDYPGADIILRSHDAHDFRVPKSYIVKNTPVLEERIHKATCLPNDTPGASLPVIQLPESGAILHSLLTFIFPGTPLLPFTTENYMELLSVAQNYQMDSALAHIRLSIAQRYPPSTQRDSALSMYSLAQKYGLRQEALQAARIIMNYPMRIEDLEDKLDVMSGACLYELWKYSEQVRASLASDLTEFKTSRGRGTLTSLCCTQASSSQIPCWLDEYITSIGASPNLFDIFEFNSALARHLSEYPGCSCGSITSQTIRYFWEALASVLDGSFEKAESALPLRRDRVKLMVQANSTTPVLGALDLPDANLIIQSSDLVNFRVHKSVLAIASPVFQDIFSRHDPSSSESHDGLPVVKLTEDAELLNSLFSMLYPFRLVIPKSYEKVLYLLEACQKYGMDQVQSSIRAEVGRGSFPIPTGTEVFGAYAIASAKGLIPEMEDAACSTLDYPMTFESLGEGLRLFEGSALRDLTCFRKRCRDNLVTCFRSFLNLRGPPFNIWMSCKGLYGYSNSYPTSQQPQSGYSPFWLTNFFQQRLTELGHAFTKPLPNSSNIREEYISALQAHTTSSGNISCIHCVVVHAMRGEMFCEELEDRLALCISSSTTSDSESRMRANCDSSNLTAQPVPSETMGSRRKKKRGKKK